MEEPEEGKVVDAEGEEGMEQPLGCNVCSFREVGLVAMALEWRRIPDLQYPSSRQCPQDLCGRRAAVGARCITHTNAC